MRVHPNENTNNDDNGSRNNTRQHQQHQHQQQQRQQRQQQRHLPPLARKSIKSLDRERYLASTVKLR